MRRLVRATSDVVFSAVVQCNHPISGNEGIVCKRPEAVNLLSFIFGAADPPALSKRGLNRAQQIVVEMSVWVSAKDPVSLVYHHEHRGDT